MGTTAAACVERANYPKLVPKRGSRPRNIKVVSPPAEDALEPGFTRCGVAGVIHPSPTDCITDLRDLRPDPEVGGMVIEYIRTKKVLIALRFDAILHFVNKSASAKVWGAKAKKR